MTYIERTISGVVDDLGQAVRSVSLHIKGLDLHLELPNLVVFLSGEEVGVSVDVTSGLGVRDGLVEPVVSIVRLECHDVTELLAVEKPRLNRLDVGEHKQNDTLGN